jgi:hypothetical protein
MSFSNPDPYQPQDVSPSGNDTPVWSLRKICKILYDLWAGNVSIGIMTNGPIAVTTPPVGFAIPPYDSTTYSYFGSTNNVETIVFKKNSVAVATLTFTYVNGGAANDDQVASITQS